MVVLDCIRFDELIANDFPEGDPESPLWAFSCIHAEFTPGRTGSSRSHPMVMTNGHSVCNINIEDIMTNSLNKVALTLAALVASAPIASHAVEMPALDRCVDIFVKEVVPAHRPADVRREDIEASIRPVSATRQSVVLLAKNEHDAKLLGHASCVFDRKGSLVAMYLYDSKSGAKLQGRPKIVSLNQQSNNDVRTANASDTNSF